MKNIIVVGGGLTGLSCAYFASRAGHRVTLLEASDRLGGLLATFELNGTKLEQFYHHHFTHDAEFIWLLKELIILDRLVFYDGTMGIFTNDKIYKFDGPINLLKMDCLKFDDKIRFGLTSLYLANFADWKKNEDKPVVDWLITYAGKRTTELIWEPLLKSKFGSNYNRVPLSWMIGRLAQRAGSRKRGKEKLGYLDGSLDILVKQLTSKLKDQHVDIYTGCKVTNLIGDEKGLIKLETTKGEFLADKYIFTTPTPYLASLIRPLNPDYANMLAKIKYLGAVCVILELTKPLGEVYWLNIAQEGYSFGGVIEHTNLVSPKDYSNSHVVYLSRYYDLDEKFSNLSDEAIQKTMLTDLKKIYPNLKNEDIKGIHVFKSTCATTLCDLNFSHKVPACKTPLDNLHIVNMAHLYPDERSCNNSIRTAANACRALGIDTSYVPTGKSLAGLIGMG